MLTEFIKKNKNNKIYIFVSIFIIFGIFLRINNLSGINFTGDETNTLKYLIDIKGTNPNVSDFIHLLFHQNRGPGQYIINYINTSLFGYINELQIRLPFLIFSISSLYTIYIFVRKIFGKKTAFISISLFSINGLFIMFSRSAQYQSVIISLIPLILLFYYNGYTTKSYKKIILAGTLQTITILFHYDAIALMSFIVGFTLISIFHSKKTEILKQLKMFFTFIASAGIIPFLYFLEFVKNDYFNNKTSGYLSERVLGGGFMPKTPYYEVGKILSLYMPPEIWILLFILVVITLISFNKYLTAFTFKKRNVNVNINIDVRKIKILYFLSIALYTFAFFFSLFPIKPRLSSLLIYNSSLGIFSLLFISKKIKPIVFGLVSCWLLNFIAYFYFIRDPKTHVYLALIPGIILASLGIYNLITLKSKILKNLFKAIFLAVLLYISIFNLAIYRYFGHEYPWDHTTLFGKELIFVNRKGAKGSMSGVYGFGNKRHWAEIRELYEKGCITGNYKSNEKDAVSKFYLGEPDKDHISGSDAKDYVNFIYVTYPTNTDIRKLNAYESSTNLIKLKTYYNNGIPVTYVFGLQSVYKDNKLLCE